MPPPSVSTPAAAVEPAGDRFDEAHPYRYTTEFPVLTDRIKVEGRQWLEPTSATTCTFRAVIQLSILSAPRTRATAQPDDSPV